MTPTPSLLRSGRLLGLACAAAAALSQLPAADYPGNGNAGFGGAIGQGTLTLTDDGVTVTGTITKGTGGDFNDTLVLYIDSVGGGFADTSGFADAADDLRRAISGFDGGTNRSTLTFLAGFEPDYAIALGPVSANSGGLWQLANGGGGSLPFVTAVNLTPLGSGQARPTRSPSRSAPSGSRPATAARSGWSAPTSATVATARPRPCRAI